MCDRDAVGILAQLASDVGANIATQTEQMAKLAGLVVNNVLYVGTVVLPSSGWWRWQGHVTAGAVWVDNRSEYDVTVSAAGPGDRPTSGVGTWIVPALSARAVCVASRQVTIYGTETSSIGVQIVTHPLFGGAGGGVGSISGGTP